MRFQLNKTKMEKDEAEKEHREYKAKSQRDLEIKDEVRNDTSTAMMSVTGSLELVWLYSLAICFSCIV